jgi:hypothetical protein
MPISELRILPPLAIARLGASPNPLEAYSLALPEERPLDFRRIRPEETLEVDPNSGAITRAFIPERIRFRDGKEIRPVAPFLEVWVRTSEGTLEPLTLDLLKGEGLGPEAVRWSVEVANIKAFRRTGDEKDRIAARVDDFSDHDPHALLGKCDNFFEGRTLPFGGVRYIRPTAEFPEIRLRFTPAGGHVYGASDKRHTSETEEEDDPVLTPERIIYDPTRGKWRGYREGTVPPYLPHLTNPGAIYAGYSGTGDDEPWLSWGYLDDACDGTVTVQLALPGNTAPLVAHAHISSGPPTFAPDALPIRTAADELLQIVLGPEITEDEEVPIEEALEIVRRALDSIRMLNTAVMNGNPIDGRLNVASTMVRQDSNDYGRQFAPIMASSLVDNFAVRALHERVFAALSSGSAPWFAEVLRRPEEIGDLSDKGRRKMPAMMRGADGRMLALTRRQIHQVIKAATHALFQGAAKPKPRE